MVHFFDTRWRVKLERFPILMGRSSIMPLFGSRLYNGDHNNSKILCVKAMGNAGHVTNSITGYRLFSQYIKNF